jgi:hypothetical protein
MVEAPATGSVAVTAFRIEGIPVGGVAVPVGSLTLRVGPAGAK